MTVDPLAARLFGYGVLYQVRWTGTGGVEPLRTDAAAEAAVLARELAVLAGAAQDGGVGSLPVPSEAGAGQIDAGQTDAGQIDAGQTDAGQIDAGQVWAVSMPFGRCGLYGLPREHLRVYHHTEAYLDLLGPDGVAVHELPAGRSVMLLPGVVARVRARAAAGRRVLMAFQTEDRTPLLGNAGAFSGDDPVPEEYSQRLRVCHAAFSVVQGWAAADPGRYRAALEGFLGAMARRVQANAQIGAAQATARATGTYDAVDQEPLFARQRAMLTADVLARLGAAAPELYRFPGMFGGIAALYRLVPETSPAPA